MITIILLFIIIAIITIFSVQNAVPVSVSFLFWRFEASLAIVIFLSLLAGIILTVIIAFSKRIRRSIKGKPDLTKLP